MIDFELTYEKRLNLNKKAGELIHAFGEGYFITDEYGREVNTFTHEKEFNRLIEKFRYRHFLIEKLKEKFNKTFEFGEDNVLFIYNRRLKVIYWNLPKNKEEVGLFFKYIRDKYTNEIDSVNYSKNETLSFNKDELP
tara:strand:+ start:656 stop:1066 length:411 start_codon:yes stop_codon:yes gene_type:complete